MSAVVPFPRARRARNIVPAREHVAQIVILPAVRIERHVEENEPVIPFCMCCGKPLKEEWPC